MSVMTASVGLDPATVEPWIRGLDLGAEAPLRFRPVGNGKSNVTCLVEDAGGRVAVVAGEKTNIKLTSPDDLVLAEAILAARGVDHHGERHGVFG